MFLNFVRLVQISGGIIVFYDVYLSLCKRSNKKPSVVAAELGINKSNVSNWKNNGYTPRGEALQKIADYFGVTTDYLLAGEEKVPTPWGERPKSKLRSIARLEDSQITPEQDEQIADYIDYLLSKKKDQ